MTSTAANFHFDSADFVVAAHPLQGFVVFDSHDQGDHEMVNSNLTPKQARKLAKALKRAADAVDKPAAPISAPEPKYKVGQVLETYEEVRDAHALGFPLHRGCGIASGQAAPRQWWGVSSSDTPDHLGVTYTISGEA